MNGLLIVYLPYATFGLEITEGFVSSAPPIASWSLGSHWVDVGRYYRKKGAKFKAIKNPLG